MEIQLLIVIMLLHMYTVVFCTDVNKSWSDGATDGSTVLPQKGRLHVDTAGESVEKLPEETEIASDWNELARLSSSKKLEESGRPSQVSCSQKTYVFQLTGMLKKFHTSKQVKPCVNLSFF